MPGPAGCSTLTPVTWDAVVLTGGTAARMDGADKAALEVDGATLLERALVATAAADRTVVVGAPVPTSRPVLWAREDPPGGGPAAGLLAGLDALRANRPTDRPGGTDGVAGGLVVVLAVDMPRVSAATFDRLTAALDDAADGALLVDADGRQQLLCAVHRTAALQRARPVDPADEHGLPVRRLLAPLRLVEVPALPDEARDVDTWDDVDDLRRSSRAPRRRPRPGGVGP